MIYFDLDGVLRDICGAAGFTPTHWNWHIKGIHIVDYFTRNKQFLFLAKPTPYVQVLKIFQKYFDEPVSLLTSQPEEWKPFLYPWIKEHIGYVETTVTSDKLNALEDGDVLIEDNPSLECYDQVILVDMPYNRDLKLPHRRVYCPDELFHLLLRRSHVDKRELHCCTCPINTNERLQH